MPITDFSVSSIGFQVRYRLQLAPLPDLFLVYSRGGADARDDEGQSFAWEFRSAIRQRTGEQLFAKLAYCLVTYEQRSEASLELFSEMEMGTILI